MDQYFGPSPIYDDVAFRDVFGVPKVVYRAILEVVDDKIRKRPDAVGKPSMPPDIQVLTMLRMGRAALATKQLDDQVGFAKSTILQK